jgi:hypothetical protein
LLGQVSVEKLNVHLGGKTTLLASLHDAFQRKPFAGFLAAGSRTLLGFEERCFDSRAPSEAQEPKTLRTTPAEVLLFYHMWLRNQDLESEQALHPFVEFHAARTNKPHTVQG